MAIDFKTFLGCVPFVVEDHKPVMIRGRHGVGKSEVVYQYANGEGFPVVERRASQMTEGDLVGLPRPEGVDINGVQATAFNPPDWYVTACTEPVVLFLDEVDRATTEVRQGIFELTDSRKLNGHYLHPDTIIFAAINGGEHGDQYQVNEMDPAELDRYVVFDVEPSIEDWLSWGKENVHSLIWDFINQNRNHLEHEGDYEPNKVYPSRRSWKRLNDCLSKGDLLVEASPVLFNLATAYVGFEAAVAFNDFVSNYEHQVTVEEVIDEGKLEKTSNFDINAHSALVEKMEAKEIFKEKLSDEQVQNLANYFVTLPSEVAMKLWTVLGGGELDNTTALHQAKAEKGCRVSDYLVQILTGNSSEDE